LLDVALMLRPDETRNDAIYDFLDIHIFSLGAFEPCKRALFGFRSQLALDLRCRIARLRNP
jgi:hypothetical protein